MVERLSVDPKCEIEQIVVVIVIVVRNRCDLVEDKLALKTNQAIRFWADLPHQATLM